MRPAFAGNAVVIRAINTKVLRPGLIRKTAARQIPSDRAKTDADLVYFLARIIRIVPILPVVAAPWPWCRRPARALAGEVRLEPDGNATRGVRRINAVMIVCIQRECLIEGYELCLCASRIGFVSCRIKRAYDYGRKYADDGDDQEQLDQGEARRRWLLPAHSMYVVYRLYTRAEERKFLFSRPFLNFYLTPECRASVLRLFRVCERDWPPGSRVARAQLRSVVSNEPLFYIIGDPHIQSLVGTLENIYKIRHFLSVPWSEAVQKRILPAQIYNVINADLRDEIRHVRYEDHRAFITVERLSDNGNVAEINVIGRLIKQQ